MSTIPLREQGPHLPSFEDGCCLGRQGEPYGIPARSSLQPAIAELERAFLAAVSWFKPQVLPPPVLTIQSRATKKAVGWFCGDRWENAAGDRLPEINLCAEDLDRDVLDIVGTLLHEMVHYANHLAGLRDCSSNQYHNPELSG